MQVNKKSFIVFWSLVIAFAGSIVAWNIAYPSGTWRYRLTVNVETPEGLKSGSAVREVHVVARPPFALPQVGPSADVRGEAVVVDLGTRGKLFALVDTNDENIVIRSFPGHGGLSAKGIRYYNSLDNASASVPWEAYPRIVTFKDINDPKTVIEPFRIIFGGDDQPVLERIRAQDREDNLKDVFGKGVKLKNITVEMTNDPVTWQIEEMIPWLPIYYNRMLDGKKTHYYKAQYPIANSLGSGNFKATGPRRR